MPEDIEIVRATITSLPPTDGRGGGNARVTYRTATGSGRRGDRGPQHDKHNAVRLEHALAIRI
jgi:hypothetical protein